MESYGTYNPAHWSHNSVLMCHRLAAIFPHLVHIEPESFNHPTWQHPEQFYREHYNYTNNYSVHIYWRDSHFIPSNEEELEGYNCTLGDVMRYVLYGKPQLRSNVTTNGYTKKRVLAPKVTKKSAEK